MDQSVSVETRSLTVGGDGLAAQWWVPAREVPDRPPLVLLHEGLGCIAMWKRFPAALATATGRRVFAYDRLGYGGSGPLKEPRGTDYLHRYAFEELVQVLDAEGIEAPVLVGHSDGGSIALLYASRHRPTAIVTVAAHVHVETVTLAGIREAVHAWNTTDIPERLTKYHGTKTRQIFHAWADTWQLPAFTHWNIEECLPQIACPGLIVQGARDEYATEAHVEAICRGYGGAATPLIIPDCGHSPHLQAPDALIAAIGDFIAAH